MEGNKEEAIRAKEIAEKKMESKDFIGAQKLVLRAQQLYPDLEDISQMILVCDVHCSAETRVFGNEKDWYRILKVEPTTDEALIRKQYRKFALLLHPDKNKFHGASDAFKIISEAQKLLLDRAKRMLYDSRYKAFGKSSVTSWASQNAGRQPSVVKPTWLQNDFRSNISPQFMNQPKATSQSGFVDQSTFWTVCPFCSSKCEYYRSFVNKYLVCANCKQNFTAYETNAQGGVPRTNGNQPSKMEARSIFEMPTSKVRVQEGVCSGKQRKESFRKAGGTSEVNEELKPNADTKGNAGGQTEEHKPFKNTNRKKSTKQVEESSESCNTETGSDSDEDIVMEQAGNHPSRENFGFYDEQYPRRSTRSKRHVSYNENLSDDDVLVNPSKRAKCPMNKSVNLGSDMNGDEKEAKQKEFNLDVDDSSNREEEETRATRDDEKTSEAGPSSDTESKPMTYELMDPEFSDFDKDRKAECFAVGQIWAVYDTLDAMPRFHALISKVISREFKMRITWLETEPDDKDEKEWVDEGLPVSCGKFKRGTRDDTEAHAMFSHLVFPEKFSRSEFKIFPRKDETWALFKDWDIKWHSDPNRKENFEYDFVEVLSDYSEDVGIHVAYLGKIKGFRCLFGRIMMEGTESVLIPRQQLFRFSHRIPSFQMTGEERADVPKGSFELDPASLPLNLEDTTSPETVKKGMEKSI